ncbi:hypothetical protein ACFL5K_05950 [Gemmatimonadota bacterium]
MSDHNRAIVPLESWCYSSPELLDKGKTIDIGLFAEAFIYYESVAVNITNQTMFAEFLMWFIKQGCLDDLLALVQDGTIQIYDYAFSTNAILDKRTGEYSIYNTQDTLQAQPNTFERRFLYHKEIEALFPKARQRKRLYEAFREHVIEVKASDFAIPIKNAQKDFNDPQRNALILQSFVDELCRIRGLGKPNKVTASVKSSEDGITQNIRYNINLNELSRIAGSKLNFHNGIPLTASVHSNRLIWSAALLSCDLYLGQPMGMLVGDKLYESTERIAKAGSVIEDLKAKVEFPDVRSLVNSGVIGFQEILKIRHKAKKFRDWLKEESSRDREAIIAYHNEVAREIGIVSASKKCLGIFGVIAGGYAGSLIETSIAGPIGAALGGTAGKYLEDIVTKMGVGWKPLVFGTWLSKRIKNHVKKYKE